MIPPTGRLKAKKRPFHEIVFDMRHVVFSVVRQRPMQGAFGAMALGTGFFVAPDVFITCDHVLNGPTDSHQAGDQYLLVANLTGTSGRVYTVAPTVGQDLHLFPNLDLAVFKVPVQQGQPQPFIAFEYGDIHEGTDIGVVGYPIPELNVVNGNLVFNSLIYRAARGHVTARYTATLDQGKVVNAPIVEVNFLFVPGNSGGPVFDAETGRVLGFVKAYRPVKIKESVATVSMIQQMPLGMSNQYVENLNAIYSLALKLDFIRATIEGFGAPL